VACAFSSSASLSTVSLFALWSEDSLLRTDLSAEFCEKDSEEMLLELI
jgi:hypothetical protein